MLRDTMDRTGLAVVVVKWLLMILLTGMALAAAGAALDWQPYPETWTAVRLVFAVMLAVGLIEPEGWQRLTRRFSPLALHLLAAASLLAILALLAPSSAGGYGLLLAIFGFWSLLLAAVGLLLKDRTLASLVNLGLSAASLLATLMVFELLLAPPITAALKNAQREAARVQAIESATAPLDSVGGAPAGSPAAPAAALTEFVGQPGPGPAWGPLTGWGTNTNTTVHSWMDGVYDVMIQYNSLGFRGPEISYDKPDDVYRVMLVGDSYVEALQVEYADTVYARLGEMLKNARTADGKRIEVFGIGATGWGTLQAYLYYHHEGYKFHPDLIIDFFVINDVADNNPRQFYDYRDIDFQVTGDTVQVVQGQAAAAEAESPGRRLLAILPPALQTTRIGELLRQLIDPPRMVVGLGGVLEGIHPQNYIYVSYPQIEGYAEGWQRTEQAYAIWAKEARANDAQLMVVQVDISAEKITELSTYYRDVTSDWIWDIDLPYKRLQAVLEPLGVPLINTRDYYARYADSVGLRPFDALFIVQDWHWNAEGHRVTAELLAQTLRERGIVSELPG